MTSGCPRGASVPQVSVLIPVYQAAETLSDALDSILGGTLDEIEVVTVDDGSTDGSLRLLQERQKIDSRLKVITTPHRGITKALETALEASNAAVVARMDADDISHPERLLRQHEALQSQPGWSGLGCRFSWLEGSGVTRGMQRYAAWQNSLVDPSEIHRDMFVENPVTHATLMIRREALVGVGGYRSTRWSEDYDLVLRLLLAGHHLGKIRRELYFWRERPERVTRTADHCSAELFHQARAHYLCGYVLQGRETVDLWGVGALGEQWRRSLSGAGFGVCHTSLNPRRLKVSRGGAVLIPPERLPDVTPASVVLLACGTRKNRELMRAAAVANGLEEQKNFWCIG